MRKLNKIMPYHTCSSQSQHNASQFIIIQLDSSSEKIISSSHTTLVISRKNRGLAPPKGWVHGPARTAAPEAGDASLRHAWEDTHPPPTRIGCTRPERPRRRPATPPRRRPASPSLVGCSRDRDDKR
jgi:hypothetical protein